MKAVINPGRGEGLPVRIPSSKSLSHRALIAASLCEGESLVRNCVRNNDTEATMNALRHLGASFTETEDHTLRIQGISDFSAYDGKIVDCGESGSTLRFLIPVFSLVGREVIFTGHGKLMSRPQTVYEDLFLSRGLFFEREGEFLRIRGRLPFGNYRVRGDVSSQFISGLLFALPLLKGKSEISITPPYESRSYVGLTEDVLESAGIRLYDRGETIGIEGNDKYHPIQTEIEGDASQAAFFAVLALISGKPVTVHGMRHESRQGDQAIVRIIEAFGGRSVPVEKGYRFEAGSLKPAEADLADCPDLGPALFACAAAACGETVFHNCTRLRIKESDRIASMKEELEKLGASVKEEGSDVIVRGTDRIHGGVKLSGHNDHRVVMALSVLASRADGPVEIEGAEAVSKSYPDFFRDLEQVGVEVRTE